MNQRRCKILNPFLFWIWSILFIIFSINSVCQVEAKSSRPLNIVTSFYPMYAITDEIVDRIHDVRVINSANGIHGFEPSANDVAAIYDADIFIYHSDILESWTKELEANRGDSDVLFVEASEGMDLMKVQGLEDVAEIKGMSQESLMDPHSWLDPIEAGNEAQLIAEKLSQVDPNHQAQYQENAQQFKEKAQALVDKYQPLFESAKQETFVTQHTAFSYLAQRFGLTQLGISGVSSDIEPSSRKIAEIQKFVKDKEVRTIFVEPNVSDKTAKVVAEAAHVEISELSPLESDPHNTLTFLENLDQILSQLSKTLNEEE